MLDFLKLLLDLHQSVTNTANILCAGDDVVVNDFKSEIRLEKGVHHHEIPEFEDMKDASRRRMSQNISGFVPWRIHEDKKLGFGFG
ncbi:hypothetical protein M0R45_018419 [Rubus argutus]|uniref:Uncharacterized protein n=1 Tax=Rubus argutus TaxID=59490 RepID=A0AAW1X523_RUBAR